jgi:hypothetical protein
LSIIIKENFFILDIIESMIVEFLTINAGIVGTNFESNIAKYKINENLFVG